MKVYTRINGKLACWDVETPHHATAIVTVAMSLPGNKLVAQSRWSAGVFLALIEGSKAAQPVGEAA